MKNNWMYKKADIDNDMLAARLYNVIPGVNLVNPIGGLVGLFQKSPSEEDLKKLHNRPGLSWVPGMGANRVIRQRTGMSKKYGGGKGKVWSQGLGPLIHLGLGASIGAGIGAGTGRNSDERIQRAAIGAGIGAGSSIAVMTVAKLIGKARRTRTKAEQAAYQQSAGDTVANYLVPGYATYNQARNYKRMLAEDVQDHQKK